MKLSVFTDVLNLPFEQALDACVQLGFNCVDLRSKMGNDNVDTLVGAAADTVRSAIRRRGLQVGCVASWGVNPPRGKYDPNDAAYRDQMRSRVVHLAELAETFDARNVRVYSFVRPAGRAISEADRSDSAAFLAELAAICGRRGRVLVIENEPPTLTGTCAELGDLMRRSESVAANLKLNWDIVNGWQAGELPWADGIFDQIAGHVAHLHIKGAKADASEPTRFGSMALPGRDDVPHRRLFERLAASGFDGIVTIDPHYGQFAEADKLAGVTNPEIEVVRLTKVFLESVI